MGEITRVEFSAAAIRALGKLLDDAVTRHAEAAAGDRPATAAVTGPEVEPFIISTTSGPRVGFTDDRGQLRRVEVDRISEVPAGWRPLYVGKPVTKR
jgi:hypothetical protein